MKTIGTVAVIGSFVFALGFGYVSNIIKFVSCDFEAPYKAEVIHGIGIFQAVGCVTGYLDIGK